MGLLSIGLTTLDIVARPIDQLSRTERTTLIEGIACMPAGTAAGAALVAQTLGLSVQLAGAIGDDNAGLLVRAALDRAGVDTRLLQVSAEERTSTTLLAVESGGVRSSYHALGAAGGLTVTDEIQDAARAARFLHYGAVGGARTDGGAGADLLAEAQAAGTVTSCDLISPRSTAREEVRRLLPHVDYFMPSAAEAYVLSGRDNLADAADVFLDLGAKACVIKNGAQGCYVAHGGERLTIAAHVITAIDTTSCGDSFCAGVIAGLARGQGLVEACRLGAATAALVAQGLGTLGRLKDYEQAAEAMRMLPVAAPA